MKKKKGFEKILVQENTKIEEGFTALESVSFWLDVGCWMVGWLDRWMDAFFFYTLVSTLP